MSSFILILLAMAAPPCHTLPPLLLNRIPMAPLAGIEELYDPLMAGEQFIFSSPGKASSLLVEGSGDVDVCVAMCV